MKITIYNQIKRFLKMSKFFNLLVLFLLLFSIGAPPVNAYWLENKAEHFTMHGEREQAPPSSRKGIFTVQDNFNLFTRQDNSSPILLPDSDYFIAADSINTNLPIFGIFSHPVKPAGDPIANLIYANLKLKKLVDDYTALQEKAQKLLSSSYSHIPRTTMQFTTSIPIHRELKQLSTRLSTVDSSELTSAVAQTPTSAVSPQSSKSIITLHTIGRRHSNRQQSTQIATNTMLKTNRTYYSNGNNHVNQNHTQQTIPSEERNNNNSYSDSAESTMRTILEFPFKVFQYILTHTISSLFIFLLTVIIIKSIFGSR